MYQQQLQQLILRALRDALGEASFIPEEAARSISSSRLLIFVCLSTNRTIASYVVEICQALQQVAGPDTVTITHVVRLVHCDSLLAATARGIRTIHGTLSEISLALHQEMPDAQVTLDAIVRLASSNQYIAITNNTN